MSGIVVAAGGSSLNCLCGVDQPVVHPDCPHHGAFTGTLRTPDPTPVDPAAVADDDALLDAIRAGYQPSGHAVYAVLAAWRRDVDADPFPPRPVFTHEPEWSPVRAFAQAVAFGIVVWASLWLLWLLLT